MAIANINCKLLSSLAQFELSQIPPTLHVIISKTALKQVFIAFGKALPYKLFRKQNIWQSIIIYFISFG